jgi:hypothetical protein
LEPDLEPRIMCTDHARKSYWTLSEGASVVKGDPWIWNALFHWRAKAILTIRNYYVI